MHQKATKVEQDLASRNLLLEAVLVASEHLLLATDVDAAADGVIMGIGQALRVDRIMVGRLLPPDQESQFGWITFVHEWTAEGIPHQSDNPNLRTFNLEHYAEFLPALRRGEPISASTEEIPTELGRMEQEATGAKSQFHYPIMVDGELWGTFGADDCHEARSWNESEVTTLRLVATALGSLVKRQRLTEARVIAERELAEERSRMARDIHDTLAQGFTGVIMQLLAAEDAFENEAVTDAPSHVALALDRARMGLTEARRSVYALRPPMMENGDLAAALRVFISRVLGTGPLIGRLHTEGNTEILDTAMAVELFRIAQEALGNTIRHAAAKQVEVSLKVLEQGSVELKISDDGRGINSTLAEYGGGFGLISMRERATRLQAQFSLISSLGGGTQVRVLCPPSRVFATLKEPRQLPDFLQAISTRQDVP